MVQPSLSHSNLSSWLLSPLVSSISVCGSPHRQTTKKKEELIKAHPSAFGKDVRRERGSETRERGIYVDDVRAFEQADRYSKDSVFLHAFSNLQLR